MHNADLLHRIQQLEDQAALKRLVDTFSNLADQKDIDKQVLLFTEHATVESFVGDTLVSSLSGREQIGHAFAGYLGNFHTVYHHNGQQTVDIDGDQATGSSYCLVVLIGVEDGKNIKTSSGVFYSDRYVRRGGEWLIDTRVSRFAWQERSEMPAAA